MINTEDFLAARLIGNTCRDFRLVETGTLIVYFDAPTGEALQNIRLWIDCAWRLRQNKAVLIGSFDNHNDIISYIRNLNTLIVTGVTVDSDTGDLRLLFSDDFIIDTFSYSVAGEHWELRQSDGLRIGMGPNLEGYVRMEDPDHKFFAH